ncbi:EAL domain-containing protein [Photobacterium kishitanii]|uniref:EAL domain-containing protein n=1 Tax=Photobacterium kishitanii TaxID=318456 RepID=A0A2T3KBX9_9GAMM|nr:EAL domain-containing protein [Photobacterium kishitanii]PSU82659.1 hypothetical protein C0W42_22575 [Photobacterium kishitanii]PSU92059.1 hypothetical protein C9J27_22625 [Photobacterium kishitanii]PSU95660.1 hypothetical protein C0W35_06470 [Photobacterium kishitanii]
MLDLDNLKSVLFQKKIQPFFQDIVDGNRNIVGIEILARWVEDDKVLYLPDFFITKFEKHGLLVDFTCSLIEQIISIFLVSVNKFSDDFYISLNVTEEILSNYKFKIYIKQLSLYCNIVLELTEKKSIICSDCIKNDIEELRSEKIKFAIDDYGMDNSTLLLLYDYKFDFLKLDRYFISMLLENSQSEFNYKRKLIIKNIVDLCIVLDIKLVVEGIENIEQERLLKDIGVKYFQGYLYSKPMRFNNIFQN